MLPVKHVEKNVRNMTKNIIYKDLTSSFLVKKYYIKSLFQGVYNT